MIITYGVANLLQSVAAARIDLHVAFNLRLLLRLGQHWTYLAGVSFQIAGFALALFARRDLPLFLVQSAVAAGLGVTTVLGVIFLKWKLPRIEVFLLTMMCGGITALIISAHPVESRPIGIMGVIWLIIAFFSIALLGFSSTHLQGAQGSVVFGSLAGIAFGAAAVASRPLAASSMEHFFSDPLLYLLIAHSIVGQLLLGMAMQRGSTTAAVAGMDAAAAIPAAIIGLLFLGDSIDPGKEWLAACGFLITIASVVGLAHYAKPQHQTRRRLARCVHPQPATHIQSSAPPIRTMVKIRAGEHSGPGTP